MRSSSASPKQDGYNIGTRRRQIITDTIKRINELRIFDRRSPVSRLVRDQLAGLLLLSEISACIEGFQVLLFLEMVILDRRDSFLWKGAFENNLVIIVHRFLHTGGVSMRISELLNGEKVTLSLEVFPPKTSEKYETTAATAKKIAALKPDFMSVTYGAGGGTGTFTAGIAAGIQNEYQVPVLAHLTCVSSSRPFVKDMVRRYQELGIENILALRGDIPQDGKVSEDYRHAIELIRDLHELGDFCLGGACYPEGHVECVHKADDIGYLKEKVDAGLDFLTTQMFFDNNIFYNFLYRIREREIRVPVLPGIMPITNAVQLKRSIAMSGTDVPQRFRNIVDFFGEDPAAMHQAGVIYATEQIVDLIANGIRNIHVYTMNKPAVAAEIMENLSAILK